MNQERQQYFIKGMYEGIRDAMLADDTVFVMGEDVQRSIIGATRGLVEEFGPKRVRNTPISEAAFVGACVGAAATGLRPVVDMMVSSFLYVAMDQVANQIAKLRYMSGGQIELPIVLFTASGPSGSTAAQHSENPHPMLMNVAGLKVVMPSTPADAKGLMLSAIEDPNPVVFFQESTLGGVRGPVPTGTHRVPIGSAAIRRRGKDVTVVGIGAAGSMALSAVEEFEAETGLSCEVIDPRTLVPLDIDSIVESVARTGRLVVCENARPVCSASSEIVTRVVERAYGSLKSAPLTVTWPNVPMPFSPPLEQRVRLDERRIVDALMQSTK